MGKTLYVSDLDGTLLTPDQDLSPFTCRVLNRLTKRGVAFTYATARSQDSAEKVTQGLTKALPVIIYNGGFVRQGEERRTLLSQVPSPESIARARQALDRAGLSPLVYTMLEGRERVLWRRDRERPGVARYAASRKNDPRLLPVTDDDSLYRGEIFYLTCIGEEEELFPLWQELQGEEGLSVLLQEEIYQPGEYWLELMAKSATKASAAAWLKEYLGCQRMVVFGDGLNDLSLFAPADWRCAVANAVGALIKRADQVIPPNSKDGVARFLLADTAPALALGERAGDFTLRLYRPGDLEELIGLFYQTVRTVNLGDYTQEEVEAWAPSPESVDRGAWGKSLLEHYTVVAQREGKLLGFGDMDDTGYLDRLYVHKDYQGRGRPPPWRRRWRATPWAGACGRSPSTPAARPGPFSNSGATGCSMSSRWSAGGCRWKTSPWKKTWERGNRTCASSSKGCGGCWPWCWGRLWSSAGGWRSRGRCSTGSGRLWPGTSPPPWRTAPWSPPCLKGTPPSSARGRTSPPGTLWPL